MEFPRMTVTALSRTVKAGATLSSAAKSRVSGGAASHEKARKNGRMKIQSLVVVATLATLFTGCAGTSPTRLVGNTIGDRLCRCRLL